MDEDLELKISYARLVDAARATAKAARLPVDLGEARELVNRWRALPARRPAPA